MCIRSFYFILVIILSSYMYFLNGDANTKDNKERLAFSIVNKGARVSDVPWPLGIVYYYLDHKSYDYLISRSVRTVMNTMEDVSCLTFKALAEPYHNAPWVFISNPDKIRECVHTDYNNTDLKINMILGYDCLQSRDILHSLMHAIGFRDEVTHPQRDQYVRIMWENIHPKYQSLFRLRYDDFSPVSTEYDSMSIMHFHDRAFSKNGQATIAPLIPGLMIDPSEELSPLDKMRLRLLFGHECNKRKVGDLLDSCKSVLQNETSPKEKNSENGYSLRDETNEHTSSKQDNSLQDDNKEGTYLSAKEVEEQDTNRHEDESDLKEEEEVDEEVDKNNGDSDVYRHQNKDR